ncbi:MAG: fructose-1,6-bisphosphatase, partial [Clostridiales bacterium]|nr:fructose-1,6-bisphosphatase [Clostridiales bacterium]
RKKTEKNFDEWCKISIYRLIGICKSVSSKYTRSKVRKRMHPDSEYILDELLNADDETNRESYYEEIINTLLKFKVAEQFIEEAAQTISRVAVDRLHIIGHLFDPGPHPDLLIDHLESFHDVDFQWGNHDAVWMGAAAGNWACIAGAIRVNIGYDNFDMLEIGYGINLRPLYAFATEVYRDDPCERFKPHLLDKNEYDQVDPKLTAKMHKAITIIQLKLEGQIIKAHPEYLMESRLLLDKVDFESGKALIDGVEYELKDKLFPTVNPKSPYELDAGELELMSTLEASFLKSEKLQRHIRFLFSHGSMYKIVNGNLLYHGCMPMSEDGNMKAFEVDGKLLKGKAYMDYLDAEVRKAYFNKEKNGDILWHLSCGSGSPLFGKDKMAVFERSFIGEGACCAEKSDPYYTFVNERKTAVDILREFGLSPDESRILNGHVPVRAKNGESPVKGGGLLFFIDGGISKAYHKTTGIAGYTFIANSRYMALAEHNPFCPSLEGLGGYAAPVLRIVEMFKRRMTVKDTDIGRQLEIRIEELELLVEAFRKGEIKEKK